MLIAIIHKNKMLSSLFFILLSILMFHKIKSICIITEFYRKYTNVFGPRACSDSTFQKYWLY